MGQKTNPIGNRLGIIRGWDSNWYGGRDYGDKLAEDDKIRKYIYARLSRASVSSIIIERTLKLIIITITTARPGIIIGKAGQEVDKLKEELKKITSKDVQLKGGRNQTIYYFAKDQRAEACDLPAGKQVVESPKTGLPFVKGK